VPVVAAQTWLPSAFLTTTCEPGSAVPEKVGVVSSVVEPSAGVVMTGAAGGVVSTPPGSIVKVVVAVAVLPAGSVAVAVRVCAPGDKGLPGVHDQVPLAATVAVQTWVPPSRTVTEAPASPVPATSGLTSLVVDPLAGSTRATVVEVSMVKVTLAWGEVLPAASVAVAV
jgi:hypothetical protein